ncbi:MAG: helix-turn-helix transcriptional regulator [Clostridia bacterium]|nr:helix-turn-helix transcriptional regulator [Clostridia bacterium]
MIYRDIREKLELTREEAAELLESISPERLVRIENGKFPIQPDEVCIMAQKYKEPSLCNYYCANECPIGQKYVPEVKMQDLSDIVLQMLAFVNTMKNKQDRLIEIAADGEITDEELLDFIRIREDLSRISVTAQALTLWTEKMIAEGKIDWNRYEKLKKTFD